MLNQLTDSKAAKLMDQVGEPFEKLPHLPAGLMEFLVKVSPWLAALGGVLSVIGGLQNVSWAMGNVPAWLREFTGLSSTYFTIAGLIQIATGALLLMAFKPLQARDMKGWMLLFWTEVLAVASMLVSIGMGAGSIFVSLIATLIGFYVLYEFKPYYGGSKAKSKE